MPDFNTSEATPFVTFPAFDLVFYQQSVSQFLLDGKYRNLSPSTIEFYKYHLLGFQRYLTSQNQPLNGLSFVRLVQQMVTEMAEQGRAHDTMAGRIRSCRCFFRFFYPGNKWTSIPIPLSKGNNVNKQKMSSFTTTEIRTILERADQKTLSATGTM